MRVSLAGCCVIMVIGSIGRTEAPSSQNSMVLVVSCWMSTDGSSHGLVVHTDHFPSDIPSDKHSLGGFQVGSERRPESRRVG